MAIEEKAHDRARHIGNGGRGPIAQPLQQEHEHHGQQGVALLYSL